ncbi:synaptic vesicle 2-related protein-like [Melitaea cinxia]|uniref:synaptic vesicle 2-related protein-like n=1 Tax=Melitaea cinxia TaxID=113334 RepID=UPI001E2728AB|nr:synaptic vesicle 2-related protein-like [Melitaea cinxia]
MIPEESDTIEIPESLVRRDGNDNIYSTKSRGVDDKVYTYDEAIDLTGSGLYIYVMLLVLAFALEGMALDMFGLSVIVTSACDLELTHAQRSILLSMPFLGSIVMSYPWGYVADTQGRLKALRICLWGSFILASLSAFSPNWIVLAVLRFCSTTFGYFILKLHFAFDLGFIIFTPWRLLTLVLAMPLGVAAVFSLFFVESPKFLLNIGDEKCALKFLRKISARNGVNPNRYPVKRVVLNELTPLKKDIPLLKSLLDQIVPLFKPPLLYRSVQLLFINGVIFSTNNGFYSWLPLIADRLTTSSDLDVANGSLCDLISNYDVQNNNSSCIETVTESTLWMSLILGFSLIFLNFGCTWLSSRKKAVLLCQLLISFICGVAIPTVSGTVLKITLFSGLLITSLSAAIVFSYFIDLFPTSYRGMAACLGVMIARVSGLAGLNIIGGYIVSNCAGTFYSSSVFGLSAVVASMFLPPDRPKKQ